MPRIGLRAPARDVLCSSLEDCRAKNILVELGKIYEVEAELDREVPLELWEKKTFEAVKAVRQQYPSVSINYIEIDGKRVILQLFDPHDEAEARGVFAPIIAILVLFLSILIASYALVSLVIRGVESGALPKPPRAEDIGFAVKAAAVAWVVGSLAALASSLRPRRR